MRIDELNLAAFGPFTDRVLAFGEDLGYLGDVNQGFAGLQKKYGDMLLWRNYPMKI